MRNLWLKVTIDLEDPEHVHDGGHLRHAEQEQQPLQPTSKDPSWSGYCELIRIFWTNPDILNESGYFERIRIFWTNPDIFNESGYFGPLRIFWSDSV